jgi:hypothetical protein
MKYFCYLFSLYFLALSLLPCTDIHDVNLSASGELASISAVDYSDCPHEKRDICSPFCSCGHGVTLIVQPIFQFTLKSPPVIASPIDTEKFYYPPSYSFQHLQKIFQPPQIG